jgi:hypothetical protein
VREAVRRINADKRACLHYFIDYAVQRSAGVGLDGEICAL